tara:strand:- start:147 stop:1226 length:1080 start_codon:yes stop_codon:yes gene_type:complete
MAYTDIDDASVHFQTALYTGAGAGQTVTNDGNSDLKPDFLWIKRRNAGYGHVLVDSNRGLGSSNPPYLASEATDAENNNQNWISGVGTDGFTIGINEQNLSNTSGTYVAWQWKANGGTTASNTDGTVTTTTQVNSDAGFSIVTWAGGGTGTLGHGLGETPDMWIIKNRDYAVSWAVGFSDSNILGGRSKYLSLNTTGTISTYNNFWGTSDGQISSTTIGAAGDRTINISGNDYVGYFFKAKQGYSKFGKYVGNGNASGAFVYTGFKPAWLMIKDLGAAGNWFITDHKRNPFNLTDDWLVANGSGAETNYVNASSVDYLSNGFKLRTTYSEANTSGRTYVYFAFAENPFTTSTGIPTTAR